MAEHIWKRRDGEDQVVARRRSITSQLYRAARLSNNMRAVSRGPGAYAKRVVRRKAYSKSIGATGRLLKMYGLSFALVYLGLYPKSESDV